MDDREVLCSYGSRNAHDGQDISKRIAANRVELATVSIKQSVLHGVFLN
jgi:hypothetical protein